MSPTLFPNSGWIYGVGELAGVGITVGSGKFVAVGTIVSVGAEVGLVVGLGWGAAVGARVEPITVSTAGLAAIVGSGARFGIGKVG